MSKYSKRLYSLASEAGLVEHNNKEDPFHQIVFGLTGKNSVKKFTKHEAEMVESEIIKKSTVSGMITISQKKYIFGLMKQLISFDTEKSEATIRQRLAGIVKKVLGISVDEKNPLCNINKKDAGKIIIALKKYIENEQKKR